MLNEFIEAYGSIGIFQAVSVFYGFARTKLLAIILGPFGVGIFSQANALLLAFQRFLSLGLGPGITKLTAAYRARAEFRRLGNLIVAVIALHGGVGLILILIGSIFSDQISSWAFNDPGYGPFVILAAIAGLLLVEARAIRSVFQGFMQWREFALSAAMGYAAGLLLMWWLISTLQLLGAILSLATTQAAILIASLAIFRKSVIQRYPLDFGDSRPDRRALREIKRFIGPLSLAFIFKSLSLLLIRSEIIRQLGAGDNGIYQTIWGISVVYMGFIINTTLAYGMPKVAATLDDEMKVVKVQNNSLRANLLILCPIVLALFAFRETWIPMLYSAEFLPAGDFILWQFLGDLIRAGRESLNIVILPLERFRFLLLESISHWGGWTALSILLLPQLGLAAVPLSFFLINLLLLIPNLVYHLRTTDFRLWKGNLKLMAKIGLLMALGITLSAYVENLWLRGGLAAIILAMMLLWLPTRSEWKNMSKMVMESIAKLKK